MSMDKEWIKIWYIYWASQGALVVKNPSTTAGDVRNMSSIPWSGRSPGEGYGNPLQHSCLENPMDREAWRATVHGVARESDMTQWQNNILKIHLPARSSSGYDTVSRTVQHKIWKEYEDSDNLGYCPALTFVRIQAVCISSLVKWVLTTEFLTI